MRRIDAVSVVRGEWVDAKSGVMSVWPPGQVMCSVCEQTAYAVCVEENAAILLWVRRKDGGQAMKLIYIAQYWERLKELQSKIDRPMKRFKNKKYGEYGNVFDMEKVFEKESMEVGKWAE